MEESTKKKILVVGHNDHDNVKRLSDIDNLNVKFVDDIREIGDCYKDIIESMPTKELEILKDVYNYENSSL